MKKTKEVRRNLTNESLRMHLMDAIERELDGLTLFGIQPLKGLRIKRNKSDTVMDINLSNGKMFQLTLKQTKE